MKASEGYRHKGTVLDLAAPIDRYFDAVTLHGGEGTAACFSADACVHDKGRTYYGTAAITNWNADGKANGSCTIEPLSVLPMPGRTLVAAHVTGPFPSGPTTLWYAFTVKNNLITDLDIRA